MLHLPEFLLLESIALSTYMIFLISLLALWMSTEQPRGHSQSLNHDYIEDPSFIFFFNAEM